LFFDRVVSNIFEAIVGESVHWFTTMQFSNTPPCSSEEPCEKRSRIFDRRTKSWKEHWRIQRTRNQPTWSNHLERDSWIAN
jgi:hypothetical protein